MVGGEMLGYAAVIARGRRGAATGCAGFGDGDGGFVWCCRGVPARRHGQRCEKGRRDGPWAAILSRHMLVTETCSFWAIQGRRLR